MPRRLLALLALLHALGAAPVRPDSPAAPDRAAAAWAERSAGFAASGVVSPVPIERAVADWEAALGRTPHDLGLRFRLIEALYFQGHFAARDAAAARRAAERELALAEETLARVTAPIGGAARLRALPVEQAAALERPLEQAPAAHFWCAVSWGVWAMEHGRLASARRDAAAKIRRHAELLVALDERYADAGGLRLLGRLHTATPRVPLVSGWVDRRLGIEILERANRISTRDGRNPLFLAEALLEHAPERRDEALELLRGVAARSPAAESVVEDTETLERARTLLARWERR
jgi:hypothetical protein